MQCNKYIYVVMKEAILLELSVNLLFLRYLINNLLTGSVIKMCLCVYIGFIAVKNVTENLVHILEKLLKIMILIT